MNPKRTTIYLNSEDAFKLTQMELSCLTLVANGFRTHEISKQLNTDDSEVDTVLRDAEKKLGAKNRLHAIGIAISQGLIGIDSK